MLRNVILFFTSVLVALMAGRAFWVWLVENPANLSGTTYVEFFQALDRGIAIPIAVTGIGGTVLAGISAIFSGATARRSIYWSPLAPLVCCQV